MFFSKNKLHDDNIHRSVRCRYELAGGLVAGEIILIAMIAIGFVPAIGAVVGLLSSLRIWLASLMIIVAIILGFVGEGWKRAFFFFWIGLVFVSTTFSWPMDVLTNIRYENYHEIKVINFNVLGSNIVNGWRIADFLIQEDADIIVIQEAMPIKPYLNELREIYPHQIGCDVATSHCDLLLLSRIEIKTYNTMSLSQARGNRGIFATGVIGDQSIGIAAVHLTKPYFDDVSVGELERISHELNKLPENKIMAGDFNSASWAPDQARFLRKNMLRHYWHEPPTWPVFLGPTGIAIDHIYVGGDAVKITNIVAIPDAFGSNHRGLIANIVVTH